MAEAWLDEEEEELRELRDNAGNRRHRRSNLSQAAERPERNKPEHRFPGQGPLSSIRAVIKRTSRTTSHGDQQRDRRRPEITIVAAEPIGPGSWFHGGPPGGFPPPPPPQWRPSETHPAEPPSYEQVIKEINQVQVTTTSSNAEPRRTTTCATQTDFPEEEDRNLPGNIIINQLVSCEQEAASVQSSTEISRLSNNVKNCSPQIACVNITDTTVRQEDPNVLRLPVPRPRTKSNLRPVGNHLSIFHLLASTENHTGFGDHSFEETVEINNMSHERSQNLIGSRIRAFESQSEKSDQCRRPEIAPRSINTKNSVTVKPIPPPKPLSNRISGEWDAAKDNKPKAPPREGLLPPKTQDTGNATKPDLPKKPKPPLLSGSSNGGDINDGISETSLFGNNSKETERKIPVPAPRPMVPKKSVQTDNSALPTALPRPVVSAPAPKLSIAAQSKTFTTTETPAARSFAPLAHSKSAGEVVDLISFEDDNVLSPVILPNPESTSDSKANYDPFQLFSKDETEKELPTNSAPLRKPTIIRISGKLTKSSEELQIPPPLPAEKPVGSLFEKTSAKSRPAGKKEWEQSECTEDTRSKPVLPTRPIGVKVMETQVPATKGPPGRPPPPKVSKTGASRVAFPRASSDISLSTKQNVSVLNRSKSQVLKRPQPELPPRPKPGHPLYNKYMLPVPHGIAEKDVVSKNPGELSCKRGDVLVLLEQTDNNSLNCQRGSATGEVKVSNIKIITPLDESLDTTQKDNNVPRALVLHDFTGGDVDDLSLNAGETVYLLEKIDNEWYKGKCKSCTGIFPSNHVRVLVDVPDKVTQKNITFNSVTK
ncbi:SH3 domain-containing protein 19 [Bombina bombina]|uniref:SH3 domain-containing protein 19 n=1 Tax=Bombina bombina TaxID=8345 RepID=UPI00235AF9C6|nr:SH3 domain-containing protein 19 [Bombina bombina]